MSAHCHDSLFFFFNDTATTEIYTLSLHDALPISRGTTSRFPKESSGGAPPPSSRPRSEEHTSELQSPDHLVCRLLLEKKKNSPPEREKTYMMTDAARTHATATAITPPRYQMHTQI